MATITPKKNKDGKITAYLIRVYHGYDVNGKRLRPYSTTFKPTRGLTEKQAAKEAERFALDFEERSLAMSGAASSTIKLADFIPQYLNVVEDTLAPTTFEYYNRIIRDIITPALGHLKLRDIKPPHIQAFIKQLSTMPKSKRSGQTCESGETLSPSSVKRYLTVVQSIFRTACKLNLINDNPAKAENLTLPKAQKAKADIFTVQEVAEILACLEQEPLQYQVLIQLAIFTGARRGELVALKFSDVDFAEKTIRIERAAYKIKGKPQAIKPPKDYETREISINDACCELLKLLKAEKISEAQRLGDYWNDGNWIFTQDNGNMMNLMTPTKWFSKFLKKNNLKHRKFHCLRHSSATLLLYTGTNIKQVMARLGHSNISTTNQYLHLVKSADREAVNRLDILLLPKNDKADKKTVIS